MDFSLELEFFTTSTLKIDPNLIFKIRMSQQSDAQIQKYNEPVFAGHSSGF